MPRQRSWSDKQLKNAVAHSRSYRQVIDKLGLIPAGGNYAHIKRRVGDLNLDIAHFTGKGWNTGLKFNPKPAVSLESLLVKNGTAQSYKLKKRLFAAGVKIPECEFCGWAEKMNNGRIPLELDHVNGDRYDNRIENLRILCPNCHSLQPTHRDLNRGKNK